jgi:hypothetical protein
MFAIFGDRALTVKLPRGRVDDMVAGGLGERFETAPGREMKEWVTVPVSHEDRWHDLATEALAYVRAG